MHQKSMSNFLTQNNHKNYGVSLDLGNNNNNDQVIRTDHIKKHKRNITQPLNEPIITTSANNNAISYLATASMTPSSYSNNFTLANTNNNNTNTNNANNGKIKCKT